MPFTTGEIKAGLARVGRGGMGEFGSMASSARRRVARSTGGGAAKIARSSGGRPFYRSPMKMGLLAGGIAGGGYAYSRMAGSRSSGANGIIPNSSGGMGAANPRYGIYNTF